MHAKETLVRVAVEHIRYEMWMLRDTARLLLVLDNEEGPIRNALIESFLVHARVLDDFLCNQGRKNDDVIAEHYAGDLWKPTNQLPPTTRAWINKKIAHLSTVRDEKLPWELGEICMSIADNFLDFTDTVSDPEYRRALGSATYMALEIRRNFEALIDASIEPS